MPIDSIISMLLADRQRIDNALAALQGTTTKRRGRPAKATPVDASIPEWVPGPAKKVTPKKHGRTFTPEQRAEQAARMKKMWKARRAAKQKS
jgi:hypothetical protein